MEKYTIPANIDHAWVKNFVEKFGRSVAHGHTLEIFDAVHLAIHLSYHFDKITDADIIKRLHAGLYKPEALKKSDKCIDDTLAAMGINLFVRGEDYEIRNRPGMLISILKVNDEYYVPVNRFGGGSLDRVEKFINFWIKHNVDYKLVDITTVFNHVIDQRYVETLVMLNHLDLIDTNHNYSYDDLTMMVLDDQRNTQIASDHALAKKLSEEK